MTMTPDRERAAKSRAAKRERGLVPVEVWVPAELAPRVRKYAARLRAMAERKPA